LPPRTANCPRRDPGSQRTADALGQEQLLDVAARLAIGPGAGAETLVRAIVEDVGTIFPKIAATVRGQSLPFTSARWTPFNPGAGG
jgi:hypothetical protein